MFEGDSADTCGGNFRSPGWGLSRVMKQVRGTTKCITISMYEIFKACLVLIGLFLFLSTGGTSKGTPVHGWVPGWLGMSLEIGCVNRPGWCQVLLYKCTENA